MDGMSGPKVVIAYCSPMMGTSTPLLSFTLRMEDTIVVRCMEDHLNANREVGGGEDSGDLVELVG